MPLSKGGNGYNNHQDTRIAAGQAPLQLPPRAATGQATPPQLPLPPTPVAAEAAAC